MRRPILVLALYLCVSWAASAATGKVIKVLPQFLDLKGRHAISPSLYDRDAYQAYLRIHTNEVTGVRFAVQWKTSGVTTNALTLRLEIRGASHGELPHKTVLDQEVKPGGWFSHWASLPLTGDEFKKIGEVTAWRATLWEGDQMLGEQKSFLW